MKALPDILGKLNINSIKIVNPSKSDIGPYIYNTLMADKVADEKEALIEIYKSIRLERLHHQLI